MARTRPTSLAGKSVLITGAARGIGAELARKAAARGARVALVGLEPELLAALADELRPRAPVGGGRRHRRRRAEDRGAADRRHLRRAGHRRRQRRDRAADHGVHGVGAVAGAHHRGEPDRRRCSPRTRRCREVAKREGHILLISSAAAFTVLPGMSAYCAAKAGLERFGDALRLEVAHRGVTVGQRPPDLDRHRPGARHRGRAADASPRPASSSPGRWAPTPRSRSAPRRWWRTWRRRGRRVFVPRLGRRGLGLRQLVTGVLAEKLVLARSRAAVPQLEREIADAATARSSARTRWSRTAPAEAAGRPGGPIMSR